MKYGKIDGINKPISRVVQGAIMCKTSEQDYVNGLLDACLAHGINTFDTAHGYGQGECERSVGAWLTARGVREEVVIIGKGAHPNQDRPNRVTPYDISADLADSLARLQTDYIDLYLLHRDDASVPVGPIVERLNEHKRAGHINAFGGSNWSAQRVAAANVYAAEHNLEPFSASSPNFSLAAQAKEPWTGCVTISGAAYAADRTWYAEQQMPLFTWSSLAGGFFSGRFRQDNLTEFDSYFDKLCVEVYCFGDNWGRLQRAEEMAADKGVSVANVALSYVLSQPLDIYALMASWQPSEVADNAKVIELTLSAEEIAWLEG